ncbi:HEPN domain-containing protein [Pseudomonas putida]|uniref:HEPN domain-containing protein n=1 Tax=Pseudomonas putida TaxID=303 RepID=UPI0009B6EC24
MTTRKEFQSLSEARFKDAVILLENGRYSSAYYLAGYCIEFALKACISQQFQSDKIPDKSFVQAIHTHRPEILMNSSGLSPTFKQACKENHYLEANWGVVCNWSESSRYESWDSFSANALLVAISDKDNGVLTWLRNHW